MAVGQTFLSASKAWQKAEGRQVLFFLLPFVFSIVSRSF
jgi:hypothetical protein